MARDYFDESKDKKKKKAATTTKSQSSSVNKETKTTKNVDNKTQKSTFLSGGGSTNSYQQNQKPRIVKKPASSSTENERKLTQNTTAAQRQKMGQPTQQDLQSGRQHRQQLRTRTSQAIREATSEENKGFMQRQKSGTQTEADKRRTEQMTQRRTEVAKNTGAVAKKAIMDTGSGYAQSLYDLTDLTASNRNGARAKAMKMGYDLERDRGKVAAIENEQKRTAAESRKRRDELFQKQEQRQAEWDERTKNAKGLEKAWYGAVESGTGMVADTLVGAATGTGQFGALASMGLRTYGSSANQARKEGATDKEARLYGLAQSAKEMGTELMFQGAGLAKAAYGKTGLSLADKSANILTKGLTGIKADAVGAGVRALGGTAEENVEELAGWMADPLIKELTYGKAVRNRMKENLRANIPQIGSDADAANVASYFSTPQFTDELTSEYVKSGMSKDKASELAAEMRDYYVAYYSGDQGKLDALEEDLAAKLSGQDKLSLKSWSMDELKDTFASTTLLTLATGMPGAVTTSVKGNQIFDSDEVKAVFGNDAVRKVADAVKNTSNKEMSLKAETMKDRLDSGKDLTGTQKYDLYQGYLEKVNETAKKARASYGVVENAREEQDLVPTMGRDRTGNTVYAKETQREYNEKFASTELTVEAIKNYMESDNSISDDEARRSNAVKKAVSDLHVGGLTVGDAHEFAYGNTLAREALKAEEDIDLDQYIVRKSDGTVDLAATNEATENALFQINADNAIRAAQAETEVFIDDTRGNIDKDVLTRFGNNGQAIWKEVNKDLDPRDLKNYLTTANAASYFYSAGRNTDMGVDAAINNYADLFKTVDNSVLKRAYAAGARDRIIANTPGYGQTVTSGSNISLKKTKPVITGQLIMDKDVVIPDSDQSAYLALAMSTNTNIHIVSSLKSKQGVEINGMSHGNDIYLNMNAAAESNLGYVFMHEMTHQIKQYAPNEYLALENLVRDRWFNKDQKGMQKAIKDRIDLYSTKGGQQLTEEEAVEEIIADAMAEAMDDPDFAAEVCEQDITLGEKILDSIREALRSIRNMFASTELKNDRFHNSLLSYLGILDEAEKMWLNALATAKQNKANGLIADWQDKANKQNSPRLSVTEEQTESMETTISDADRKTLNNEGIEELDDGTTARYSVTSWGETNKDKKLKALVAAGHNKEAASKWIDDVNSIASIILDDPERLDYEADRTNKFLKPNGDYYKYTLDASTLCDKRRIYQGTYNAIQHIIPNAPLMQDDVVRIRTLLKDMDHKAPCGICYVESQRKNLGQYAKEWYDSYARKDEIKLADVTTSDGLKELKKTNPEVASDFEKAMAAKGVSSPKVVKLRTDYREDIMRMRPATIEYLNSIGGLRFHSFSDFETPHLLDTMQAVMDMATKNLMGMAYAKVPNFAAVFGPTGIKINLSLIAKTDENGNAVHDENGRLVFDSVEGIPFEEASKWRDAYPDNVAFILVGKDKEHTLEAINDDRVDFVIPFHRSKWSAEDMRRLGLVGYEDFATGHQENGVFVSEFWDYNKTGKENAERYLEVCKEKGVTPIFEQLLKENEDGTYSLKEDGSTDNYWKLLVEGKMYNHFTKKGAPQKPVQPNFNMDEARRVLNEYEGGADTLPVADDVVKAFIKEYKQNHPDVEIADAKMSISVDLDEPYMQAVNSGNMDEAQRLVDEAARNAGYTVEAFHGTKANFNKFRKNSHFGSTVYQALDRLGFYNDILDEYEDDPEVEELLSRARDEENAKVMRLHIKAENPIRLRDLGSWDSEELREGLNEVGIDLPTDYKGADIVNALKGLGYDSIVYENLREGRYEDEGENDAYILFDPRQAKLADPVTYDDNGDVIPLSERFDPTNNDIRYSLPTQDTDGNILTDGQMEYFKNSQARDIFGRLVPVYHATDMGGFTIFDPWKSDDHRSLFFSNRRDVAKTYAYNGGNAFDFEPKQINDWNDLIRYGRQLFSDADMSWDNDTDDNNLDFELYDKASGNFADISYDEWLSLVESNDPHADDYKVKIKLPYNNKDGETEYVSFEGDSAEDLLSKVSNGNIPHGGHYQVYLNLENPLIIDGQGQPWNDIVDGGSVFPSFSYVRARDAEWYRKDADNSDEMYAAGQRFYNGDDSRAIAEELSASGLIEIEAFDGKKKHKATVSLDADSIAQEVANAFGIDDMEIVSGIAEEIALDMEISNSVRFGATDMRNTIGEYGYSTREWAEFAEDEGYDGVIFRNIIDIDDKTEMFDSEEEAASDIYVAFSSNQVKDINNENPTENPDIRYSITPEDEAMSKMANDFAFDNSYERLAYYETIIDENISEEAAYEKAKKYIAKDIDEFYAGLTRYADGMRFDDPVLEEGRVRMAKSKQDYFNSNVAKWNQNWLTDGEVLDIDSVKKPIKDLVMANMMDSNTSKRYKADLVKKMAIDMRLAYYYAKQGRTDVADALLWHSAFRMVDGVEFYADDENYETYKNLRDYFRNNNIQLGEEYWSDTDYAAFRKANFGRLNLVKGKTNLDKVLDDLYHENPDGSVEGIAVEWFNPEAFEKNDHKIDSVPDILLQIADVLDDVEPYAEAYSSDYCAEWATDLASSLLDIMASGKELQSTADKYRNRYEAKVKAMKARHAEAMLKVRQQKEDAVRKEKLRLKEYVEKKKEQQAHKTYFERIKETYDSLVERLSSNTADKHIPEQYKKELAKLLAAFDLQTVGSKARQARTGHVAKNTIRMAAIKEALKSIEDRTEMFHVNDAITDLMDELSSVEGKTIDLLSATELWNIDRLLRSLLHEFNRYEKVRIGAKNLQAADLADAQVSSALEHAKIFGPGNDYRGPRGWIDQITNMDEMTPAYMFRRIDPDNVGLGLMWKEIRRSQDKYIRNTEQINKWMEEITGKYKNKGRFGKKYGSDEIEKWRSSNYITTFELENGTVELTPAQMMSLYCLSKRNQAYGHMVGAGIVVAPVSFQAKIMSDLKKKINRSLPVILTDADIKTVVSRLTPEQVQVADQLQELMSTKMADLGNEASMNVLGIKLFNESDYFPIKSDKAALERDLTNEQFENAIRNFGFTKAVQPGARNAIMIEDIFDVVTEHCNNMNLYNSYSETLNDFMKVFNKHSIQENGADYSVRQALAHAYSQKATTFIMEFIRDLNGNTSRGRTTGIETAMNDTLANAKKASVFANLRVLAQQPTAITRAFAVISPKYLKGVSLGDIAKGIIPTVTTKDMQEMFDHCPIALWKSWGYYDINMGKSIESVIMNEGNWLEDMATQAYGKADNITWTAIWQMVKAETKDLHPELKEGTDEYWEHCNERMSEIVDLTQVVDSPLHRSHAMRAKDILHKTMTSFMAEPTLTFNMIRDGWIRAREAWIKGDKAEASKIIGKTAFVAGLQAATVAAAAAVVDALRGKNPGGDDDEDKSLWLINFLNNLKDEMKIWNKIYYIKDLASIAEGWDNANLALQGWKTLVDGFKQFDKKTFEGSKVPWWKIYYNLLGGIGYFTGIPFKTLMKDGRAIFELLGGELPESLVGDEKTEGIVSSDSKLQSVRLFKSDGTNKTSSSTSIVKVDTGDKWYDYENNPITVKDGSTLDKLLNHFGVNLTAAEKIAIAEEQKQQEREKKAEEIASKYADLSGDERDKKVWSAVTSYFKSETEDSKAFAEMVSDGSYGDINEMKRIYIAAGGGEEYFDERVLAESKKALKKSIKYDQTDAELNAQERVKEYMLGHGMTEEELSDIVYRSETAKDLKVAFRLNDKDLMMESLEPLVNAGLTYEDLQRLWDNRNRMQLSSYKGRYKDKLKSTGKFIWPTDGVITSHFGYRNAPTAGASSNHPAIDIGAPQGTAVVAADGGIVISAGANGGYGNSVGIKHDNGMVTWYNHLYSWNVKEGDTVAQGQQIAQVGSTGISTGPHLDFKIMNADGEPVDPEKYLSAR